MYGQDSEFVIVVYLIVMICLGCVALYDTFRKEK